MRSEGKEGREGGRKEGRKGGRKEERRGGSEWRTGSRPHAGGEVGVFEAVALAAIVVEIPIVVHGHGLAWNTEKGGREGRRRACRVVRE